MEKWGLLCEKLALKIVFHVCISPRIVMFSYREFGHLHIGPNLHHGSMNRRNRQGLMIHTVIWIPIHKFCPVANKIRFFELFHKYH